RLKQRAEEARFLTASVGEDGSFRLDGVTPGRVQVFPLFIGGKSSGAPTGFDSVVHLARAARAFLTIREGASVRVDFNLTAFGTVRVRGRIDNRGEKGKVYGFVTWEPTGPGPRPTIPESWGLWMNDGKDLLIAVVPCDATFFLGISERMAGRPFNTVWYVREEVRIETGSTVELSFLHDGALCGSVSGCLSRPKGGGYLFGYSLFLTGSDVRVMLRCDRKGKFEGHEIPGGAYHGRIVGMPGNTVKDLGEVRVVAGKTTDLGTIQLGE
ncbi:MAG: hypothetical protein ACYS47_17315, partial [Planctomycetota bacterium]